MEISKSQAAAQSSVQEGETDVMEVIEPSAVVRSEDVEQEECYTF
ncbi:hypothetical protein [Streptomyces sp. 35G-GA-8]|nr:hypothetical protein [Streptomyces sp. 35G-GA-8]